MALVAYENSDSSEFEDDSDAEDKNIESINEPGEVTSSDKSQTNLFKSLPQPSHHISITEEEDDEFLCKREAHTNRSKVKITIPSLAEFKDVESPTPKLVKSCSQKGSGLLSLLPQPKNSFTASVPSTKKSTVKTSLIPHVLQQKPSNLNALKANISLENNHKSNKTKLANLDYSDDSDEGDLQNDFFSMNKKDNIVPDLRPLPEINSVPDNNNDYVPPAEAISHDVEMISDYSQNLNKEDCLSNSKESSNQSDPSSSSELQLDDEAIRKLCGSRKRKGEVIQILDVDQKDVLADAHELLMKGIMDESAPRVSSSKKRSDGPTSQQKRKHQITYLAHQAKAQEAELQNQWANNRMNKRMAQSKYGF